MTRPNVSIPLFVKYWTENGNGVVISGPTSTSTNAGGSPMYRDFRVWTGSTTPGYKSLKQHKRKVLAPLAHQVNYARWKGTAFTHFSGPNPLGSNPANWQLQKCTSTAWQTGVPAFGHLSEAYNAARSRAAAQTNEMHINLAQAFAERKQTASLLADTAVRVTALARAIRRGDIKGINTAIGKSSVSPAAEKRLLNTPTDKRLSNHWLEYQYGWKPLLQDAYGAAKVLGDHISSDHHVMQARGSAKAHKASYGGTGAYDNPIFYNVTETRCKMGIQYKMGSTERARLAQTGIDNPALLAWELLPYSFVVDWFLPVGNYLEALNAFSGFEFVSGWVSNRTEMRFHVEYTGKVSRGSLTQWRTGFGEHYRAEYKREVLSTFPGAGLPTFKNPIGGEPLARFATAYSLLRMLFR